MNQPLHPLANPGLRRRPSSTPAEFPRLLGKWQLQHIIGQGSFTAVYAARPLGCPPTWPADYVIKMLRPEFAQDAVGRRLLEREAEVARHVSHAHLVPILEAHLEHEAPHLVMPYLQGATLQTAIERVGQLVLPQALWLTRQVAQALYELHSAGWIHADVKPANMVVSRHGHATLIDLGSAMRHTESLFQDERPLVGSMAYVAPELLTSATQTQPASDIYSLGITLFQMLTGRLPFTDREPARLVEAHLRQQPPDLSLLRPGLPEPVIEFVRAMLAKNPQRRPASGGELIDGLTELEIDSLEARFPDTEADAA